ncbi:hypothetical protein BU14_0033s0009 [Porphyra umbilicalis]|uniref:Uncharacterized protein n=1 Tax=Porphyra umbilicalis TaxID=2786 RepID=A0A1X6PIM1_PORUM|nr:hypothetical protein BU14_0033s0009 [Porphyra umbilicalis]|eukprot:OSX80665.1 hypothetical protein BU14_0033s0009 [Porphyra umbilicalis]
MGDQPRRPRCRVRRGHDAGRLWAAAHLPHHRWWGHGAQLPRSAERSYGHPGSHPSFW